MHQRVTAVAKRKEVRGFRRSAYCPPMDVMDIERPRAAARSAAPSVPSQDVATKPEGRLGSKRVTAVVPVIKLAASLIATSVVNSIVTGIVAVAVHGGIASDAIGFGLGERDRPIGRSHRRRATGPTPGDGDAIERILDRLSTCGQTVSPAAENEIRRER